jgi:hypothetical protein
MTESSPKLVGTRMIYVEGEMLRICSVQKDDWVDYIELETLKSELPSLYLEARELFPKIKV